MWSFFRTIKRSWTQHFVAQTSSLVIMSLTYSAVLFIGMSLTNIQDLFDTWGRVNKVTVYLNKETAESEKKQAEEFLRSQELISSFNLVTSNESAKRFKDKFSNLSTQNLSADRLQSFFPEYFEVSLNQSAAYKSGAFTLQSFVDTLKASFPFVASVSYGKRWLDRYINLLATVKTVGWILIFLFFIASLVVSASAIKTVLYSRRDEIEIMEFVGADDSKIYLPQVVSILFLGICSIALSLIINGALLAYVKGLETPLVSSEFLQNLSFLPASWVFGFIVLSLMSLFAYSLLTIYNLLPRHKQKSILQGVLGQ